MTRDDPVLFPEHDPARFGSGRRRNRLILPVLLSAAGRDMRLHDGAEEAAYQVILKWAELEADGRLKKMTETSLRGEFLTEVFGQALGYTLFSENLPQWHLHPEFALPGGQVDAAIGFFGANGNQPPRALIEIKGPTVNLDRDRSQGRTPVQQLWDYLVAVPGCPWGILCNYVSFRLYHREKTPYVYELFTLDALRTREHFQQFYALLERGGLLPIFAGQRPRADELLANTDTRQQEVGSKLYGDYNANRLSLIGHLRRAPHGKTLDGAIHIAQKLLDRIIFVAFCEDRRLLPGNALDRAWREIPAFSHVTNPRWRNFKGLFRSIDQGNEREGITPYNGGLFARDVEIDDLELDDEWTDFFSEVGRYDFSEEVNVDVLGHLFEQSITDLENLRLDPEGQAQPVKKPTGRRKREGIYYTPPAITRYLVEHTIGACLAERFSESAARHGVDPAAPPDAQDQAKRLEYQRDRLAVVQQLRVCDPACGSGAFLIQAYDYLEEVYEEIIGTLTEPDGQEERTLREQISETILRENLFGVDLSAEAVEITQLALWIRTARRGRTLADLSQNIQCGNSIVDDEEADPRAFDWNARFPQVFRAGKFDCVISNPPYVKLQNFRKREPRIAKFLVDRYRSAKVGNFDMYLPFMERGMDLLNPKGRMGFIAPSLWLFNEYGRGLRELVAERRSLERFVDFKSFQVFPDATTYTALQFFTTEPRDRIQVSDASSGDLEKLAFYDAPIPTEGKKAWALLGETEKCLIDAIRERSVTLSDVAEQIFQGLITSADDVYHLIQLGPGRYYSKAIDDEVELEEEIMKPLISGADAVPFARPNTEKYLLFPYLVGNDECRLFTPKEMAKQFKRCWAYLKKNEKTLRGRESGKMDHDDWFGYVYPKNLDKHERPKLLVPRLLLHLFAGADPKGQVHLDNVDVGGVLIRKGWDLYYVLAILNSKACDFVWRATSKPFRGGYRSANKQFIAPLPIPNTKNQKPIVSVARKLADRYGKRLSILARVHRRFGIDLAPPSLLPAPPLPSTLPRTLRAFDEAQVGTILNALEKFAKRKLKPPEREGWDEYFTQQLSALGHLKGEIADLETELNDGVYKLFGLNADLVKKIEAGVAEPMAGQPPDSEPSR